MNVALWLIAGAVVASAGFRYLRSEAALGLITSIAVGIITAYLGGSILAPLIDRTGIQPGDFNPFALLVAACTALACLLLTGSIHDRLGRRRTSQHAP